MTPNPVPVIFFTSAGVVVYSYAIYPLVLALAPVRRNESFPVPLSGWPFVSILISVYNEEKHISQRIENLLALDYAGDKLEILIGSDGSSDGTNVLVNEYVDTRVQLHAFEQRRGKSAVLNRLVPHARGELLVFSDANSMFAPDALCKLVRHFADPGIGGVCGRLTFRGNANQNSETSYWKLETYLKGRESALDSCLGANGAIYAIRKSHFPLIPDNTIVDDFVIGMLVREKGFRVIYDADAVAIEDAPPSIGHEMTRRIRIGAGDFQALGLCWRSLLPWRIRGFHSFAFWSHKVLRWLAPFAMIVALAANIALRSSPIFAALLAMQLTFYTLALLEVLRARKSALFSVPHYFVIINLALLFGFCRFITGTQPAAWKRTVR